MEEESFILEKAKKEQETGNYQVCLDLLKQILDSNDYYILFEYAKTLFLLKKYDDAVNIFLKLNNQNKQDRNTIDFIIKCYRENNRIEDLFSFIKSNNICDTKILLEIAETLFVEKKYKETVIFYEQYIKNNKEDINIVSKLLQIYNFLGYRQKAITLSEEYLKRAEIQSDKFWHNLFLNEQEIAQEKTLLKSNPRIMLVMLTNKCNLKCPMCATIYQKNQWEISDEFKQYILNNLDNLELITWQGGEVFLYKGFKDLFLKAKENKHLKQIIITNGLLINEQWANLITQANHLDLTISIDSIEKDIYEKLRVGARFEQLLKNLECIKKYRRKNNSNITITMRMAISDENIYTLDRIVDFVIEYKINVLVLSPLDIDENEKKKYELNEKSVEELLKIKQIFDTAFKKAYEHKIKVICLLEKIDDILARKQTKAEEQEQEKEQEQTVCFTKEDNKEQKENYIECLETKQSLTKGAICFRPWKQIATTVAGKLRPECMCLKDIDDISSCESFEKLWNNNIMQEYRKKMISFDQQWCCDNCKNNIVSEEHKKYGCW